MRQVLYAILWQLLGVAERQSSWPIWSWTGCTGSGVQLCPVINPAYEAVTSRLGGSSVKWEDNGRVFLQGLKCCSTDSEDKRIDLYPDDESLQHYLSRPRS